MIRMSVFSALTALSLAALPLHAEPVTIFAAASLKDAMDQIAKDYQADTGKTLTVSLASSSALARQIEQGAPADIFISADLQWMDELAKKDLIDTASRRNLLGNALVLVAHDPAAQLTLAKGADLAGALGDGHLAMGMVESVPAGIYGKTALTSLGLWDSVKDKVAQADSVRAALALVSTGEAPFGVVYSTDAAADKDVTVAGVFPEDSHPPIIYPIALTKDADDDGDAKAALAYLEGPKAKADFEAKGFTVLAP